MTQKPHSQDKSQAPKLAPSHVVSTAVSRMERMSERYHRLADAALKAHDAKHGTKAAGKRSV